MSDERSLEERQKDHVFQTTEEAQAWNAARVKKPTSKNHWSYKANKIKHVLKMGAAWKALAKLMHADLTSVARRVSEQAALVRELEAENTELRRMMHYCDKCKSGPGEECKFQCSRDGMRDDC